MRNGDQHICEIPNWFMDKETELWVWNWGIANEFMYVYPCKL